MEDVVKALGFLTLGTRLKRIGERLQAQTQALLQGFDISVPASQLPVLAALDRLGPLSVGAVAEALGISQPAVTRLLGNLQALALIDSQPAPGDLRLRTVALTAAGRKLVARAKQSVWPAVEAAVAEASGPSGRALLAQLAVLEDALAAAPLSRRSMRLRARRPRRASA
ncbi:MAG: MarR family transcriptional regulator [Burkholderiales bacterium]|nr:MarR family transcriptional regulator [Burkholderiales bacterium]